MELLNVTECYFVTGTDTEIGKTVASVALLQAANSQGRITAGFKPVASGSKMTPAGLRSSDALALKHNSSLSLPYEAVNLYTFSDASSPHIVSANEGRQIKLACLTQGLRNLKDKVEWVLIEGAGGWFTPLTPTLTFADWVVQEQLPVILVVGIRLGCINHAMLTARVIAQSGLNLSGWIANDIIMPGKWHAEFLSTLRKVLDVPFLGEIPWLGPGTSRAKIGQYLDLRALSSASSK